MNFDNSINYYCIKYKFVSVNLYRNIINNYNIKKIKNTS